MTRKRAASVGCVVRNIWFVFETPSKRLNTLIVVSHFCAKCAVLVEAYLEPQKGNDAESAFFVLVVAF